MELKWLEDFLTLTRTGSFGRAARQRHISQSAFSRRIQSLEHWLGVELVDRSTMPVRLTEAGEGFLDHARRIVSLAGNARSDLRLQAGAERSCIRIITLHTLAIHVVPRLVRRFLAVRPSASVEILPTVQGLHAYFEALENGFGDLVVAYDNPGAPGPHEPFQSRHVLQDRMVPVAAERVARLVEHARTPLPLLAFTPNSFSYDLVQPVISGLRREFYIVGISALAESLCAMALAGLGLAWLPETVATDGLADGRLLRLWPSDARVEIALDVCCWSRRGPAPGLLQSFLETLPASG